MVFYLVLAYDRHADFQSQRAFGRNSSALVVGRGIVDKDVLIAIWCHDPTLFRVSFADVDHYEIDPVSETLPEFVQ